MRQTLITLLAVITLLSQWGWQVHAYHDHDHDEAGHICELCVSASGHVAITPTAPQLPTVTTADFTPPATSASLQRVAPRYYPTRAPPHFL